MHTYTLIHMWVMLSAGATNIQCSCVSLCASLEQSPSSCTQVASNKTRSDWPRRTDRQKGGYEGGLGFLGRLGDKRGWYNGRAKDRQQQRCACGWLTCVCLCVRTRVDRTYTHTQATHTCDATCSSSSIVLRRQRCGSDANRGSGSGRATRASENDDHIR